MAFGNTYSTTSPGSGTLNREDLSDVVTILEPEQTPVYSMASKETATATNPEWGLDELKDPSTGAGGVSEGADVSAFSDQHENKARVFNYTQRFLDTWKVSKEQNLVSSAGGANATTAAGAKAKAARNVKRFVEYALCSDNDRQAENGAGAPYKLRGLGDWIDSSGPADVPASYRTPSASIDSNGASITEAQFNEVLRSMFTVTGAVESITLVAGSTLRQQVSNFTRLQPSSTNQRYQVNEDSSAKKITFAVNIYDSDFGYVSIVNGNPDCLPAADRGYLLPMSLVGIKSLQGMASYELEDQGGGQRGYVDCIETLVVRNPKGLGKIV